MEREGEDGGGEEGKEEGGGVDRVLYNTHPTHIHTPHTNIGEWTS